jgi:hypothetical protein
LFPSRKPHLGQHWLTALALIKKRPVNIHPSECGGVEVASDAYLRSELFISQRDQRVDAYRAPRWNITSNQSNGDEKKGDPRKRQRIRWSDAVQ